MSTPSRTTLHGTFLNVLNEGVLLIGRSGSGKSQLALSLLDRGHQLIADDLVIFEKTTQDLLGSADTLGMGYLHVRDVGMLNIQALYGHQAILSQHSLSLIIELVDTMTQQDDITPTIDQADILGRQIPKYQLAVTGNRPLPLLIETIVKQQQCSQQGISSYQQFKQQHHQKLQRAVL